MKVLVIEDDRDAAAYLVKGLTESGHTVDHALDGNSGLEMGLAGQYDALIVDRMLPGRDGLSIIKTLREANIVTPVLVLSALGEVDDRVQGLTAGGDDYLVKPFAFSELLARLQALARRIHPEQQRTFLKVADLELDCLKRKVTRDGQKILLQPREFRLLEFLMQSPGRVYTRAQMLDGVWGRDVYVDERTVDVHVGRLRKALVRGREEDPIRTVRGSGYSFDESFAEAN